MFRKTWMEINLDEIEENVKKAIAVSGKKIIAVLKADAYGCGDMQVCRAVERAGAAMVAVSSLDEAMILRNEGYKGEMLILGTVDAKNIPDLIQNNISTAAYSPEFVKEAAAQDCTGLKIHLAVDTGMNRIGFKNIPDLQNAFCTLSAAGCRMEGIFTHFCCADVPDHKFTDMQFEKFEKAVASIDYTFPWIHCDNSDATVSRHDPLSNACRFGITLYGISAYDDSFAHPVSLYTTAYMCKHVPAGEQIGYGATYTTAEEEIIVTAPIGYADGFIRANQGRKVYLDNSYGEIVGRVCMDQIMIRVDHDIKPGTPIEIFGSHISIESMAEELNTIPYEILCLITGRVTRIYLKNNKRISEQNDRLIRSEA